MINQTNFKVTPCVGVWIETIIKRLSGQAYWTVTPCVGVWIETWPDRQPDGISPSHPAWVCGLKHKNLMFEINVYAVTPCVGVWIETKKKFWKYKKNSSRHTLRGCVDWNYDIGESPLMGHCHTLRGCVDWNIIICVYQSPGGGHTLRGCVDWNPWRKSCQFRIGVTPCVGVWIETW